MKIETAFYFFTPPISQTLKAEVDILTTCHKYSKYWILRDFSSNHISFCINSAMVFIFLKTKNCSTLGPIPPYQFHKIIIFHTD